MIVLIKILLAQINVIHVEMEHVILAVERLNVVAHKIVEVHALTNVLIRGRSGVQEMETKPVVIMIQILV